MMTGGKTEATHATQTRTSRERESYRRFLAAGRSYWARDMFAALRRQIEQDIQVREPGGAGWEEFESRVQQHPTHQIFAWFERHLQRMRYSGQLGLVASVEAQRDTLEQSLKKQLPEGMLQLDPDLQLPSWYTDCDIHQHPGGLGADELAAFVYRDAIQSGVVGKSDLHARFARRVLEHAAPRRILDLGCGFGRSSYAFAATAPEARVQGMDLSASCVTVAAHEAPQTLRPRLTFLQANAFDSGLPDGSFDLITSVMLLHELPEEGTRALIRETGRLLVPGGVVAHLDFLPPADPLLRLVYMGHARRNNEPYLLEHSRINLEEAYRAAGFRTVEVTDFAEDDEALSDPPRSWRLPWKLILAVKEEE